MREVKQVQKSEANLRNLVALIVLLAIGAYAGYYLWAGRVGGGMGVANTEKAYFTIDDGKSFFVDDAAKLPPFTHGGKEAVQAYVFTCDEGKTKFVGYMMRLTPRGKELTKRQRERLAAGGPAAFDPELQANIEVKRPGAGAWMRQSDLAAAGTIMQVTCPHDASRAAQPVDP